MSRSECGKDIATGLRDVSGLLARGSQDAALALLLELFERQPQHTQLFCVLAGLAATAQQWDLLEQACLMRLNLLPGDDEALCRYAQAELGRRRYLRAVAMLEQVTGRNAAHGDAWIELGRVMKRLARIDEALRCFQKALIADPFNRLAQDNLLFTRLFSDHDRIEDVAAAHRSWGAAQKGEGSVPAHIPEQGRVAVGYLSPDLREHSVAAFIEAVLRSHDRKRFRVICYQCGPQQDTVTDRLRTLVDEWRDITDLDDTAACDLIRLDRVSILVDLAGHTAWNRLAMMALRPAPVQITWIGYPHSTGLPQIDYRITDAVADPPGMTERFHSEELVRMPGCFLCYDPPMDAPEPSPEPPAGRTGDITFGCFNNLAKVSPTILGCWRTILEQTPRSRLVIKAEVFDDPEALAEVLQRFGLPVARVVALGWVPDRTAHLALYNQIDIALDTWPYNGTTTTCESLWMGVPVVTLAGNHHAARVGASLLTAVGLEHLIASCPDEYVSSAVALAGNLPLLQALRRGLRPLLESSPLLDGPGFTRDLEGLYLGFLRRIDAKDPCR